MQRHSCNIERINYWNFRYAIVYAGDVISVVKDIFRWPRPSILLIFSSIGSCSVSPGAQLETRNCAEVWKRRLAYCELSATWSPPRQFEIFSRSNCQLEPTICTKMCYWRLRENLCFHLVYFLWSLEIFKEKRNFIKLETRLVLQICWKINCSPPLKSA